MMASMAELTDRDVLGMRLANLRFEPAGSQPRRPRGLVPGDASSGSGQRQMVAGGADPRQPRGGHRCGTGLRRGHPHLADAGTIHLIHPQNARWMLELPVPGTHGPAEALGLPRAGQADRRPGRRRAEGCVARRQPAHPRAMPGRVVRRGDRHRAGPFVSPPVAHRPDRRDLHRAERGQGTDLCSARRLGARATHT